jgi:xanthine/CO dehydrogenase XdhC/CoxF family maturation factor
MSRHGVFKRAPEVPHGLPYDRMSKADLFEALAWRVALAHPVGVDDGLADHEWLAAAILADVTALRQSRGAPPIRLRP